MKAFALIPLLSAAVGFGSIEAQVLPVNPAFAPSVTVASNEPGANLTVYLLTYNWGMFSFDEPHFLRRFLTGDTRYWMQAFDLDTMLAEYKRRNRSVLAQE